MSLGGSRRREPAPHPYGGALARTAAMAERPAGRRDGLDTWACPPPVLVTAGAARRPAARACPVRGRGRTRPAGASRVPAVGAGETEAWGRLPPRWSPALVGASLVACVAVPPGRAVISRAWPRTPGSPWSAPRAARQAPVKRQAPPPTRASRDGALAGRHGAGAACLGQWSPLSPAWLNRHRSSVRACRALPP
jgi:hypothetical protein